MGERTEPGKQDSQPTGLLPTRRNAATVYVQALQAYPALTDAEQKIVDHFDTAPLNASTAGIVERGEKALTLIRQGSSISACDWDVDYSKGPDAILPPLGVMRRLARLACLRARWRFERGNAQAAFDDLIAVMTMSRHAAADGALIACLVSAMIEDMTIATAGAGLVGQDRAVLVTFSSRLDMLPPRLTLVQALRNDESGSVGWLRSIFDEKGAEAGCKALAKCVELVILLGSGDADPDQEPSSKRWERYPPLFSAAGGVDKTFNGTEALFDELIALQRIPWNEYLTAAEAFEQKVKNSSFLARVMLAGLTRARYPKERVEAKHAMLRAAISIIADGREALNRHADPYGKAPFAYESLGNGAFELKSTLVDLKGQPVTLVVGQPPATRE